MNDDYAMMMKEKLQELNASMARIAEALEKLESKGILVWLGEDKPDKN